MKKLVLIILLTVQLLPAGNITLLRQESLEIPLAQYRAVRFALPQYQSDNANLYGNIQLNPDTASIELILLHIDDYLRWGHNIEPIDTLAYISLSSGPFELPVPGPGSYALVISNRGNYRPTAAVLDLDVTFTGTGKTGDPLPAALRIALILMMIGTVAVAVGSVLTKHFYRRKHIT